MRIYTGNYLEKLVESLAANLSSEKVDDPKVLFSKPQDLVVIQSQGMAKWLKQNIAKNAKISAHIDFPFIRGFIVKVLERAGVYEKNQIWDREVLCWRIFSLLPKYEEDFQVIGRYISGNSIRRQQLSQRLASLMDEYLTYRPDWIEFWSKNRVPKIRKMMGDELDVEHEAWQRALWQDLIAEDSHTFQRALSEFIERVEDWTHKDLNLPKRIAIFGITNMPPAFVNFFNSLSKICAIDLYHLNPCEAYWADSDGLKLRNELFEREEEDEIPDLGQSLLKSWGLLGRDFLSILIENTEYNTIDQFVSKEKGGSLLSVIQESILSMDEQALELRVDDSLQIHAAYSAQRELECVHQYILEQLHEREDLHPRDIIVMAPDIQKYSAYIHSSFGQENALAYSISDQSLAVSPMINTYVKILNLGKSRLSAPEIMEIIEHPDVLAKYHIKEGDIGQLREWIEEAAIRWGEDGAFKESLNLGNEDQNTWHFGLERLLTGYAFGEETYYQGIMGLAFNEDGDLLGKFIGVVRDLIQASKELKKNQSVGKWIEIFVALQERFFHKNNENNNEWNALSTSIDALKEHWDLSLKGTQLECEVAVRAIQSLLDAPSSSTGFLNNGITFCSLLPMRSIPAKVICILGLNEGEFPRMDRRSGFDLMSYYWRQGDRTMRLDDRYLFLESVISARESLYLSYIGKNMATNELMPPSIILGELIEFLNKSIEFQVQYEAMHAFSMDYFLHGKNAFSKINYLSAQVQQKGVELIGEFCPEEMHFPYNEKSFHLDLCLLTRFFANPSEAFLKHQLNSFLNIKEHRELEDSETFEAPNGLEKYFIKENIFENVALDREEVFAREQARGKLGINQLGQQAFNELYEDVYQLSNEIIDLEGEVGETSATIQLHFGENLILDGEVGRLFDGQYLPYRLGKNRWKYDVREMIHYLALRAQGLGPTMTYTYLDKGIVQKTAKNISAEDAKNYLAKLIDLFNEGLQKPLALFPRGLDAVLSSKKKNFEERFAAESKKAWADGKNFSTQESIPGDGSDPSISKCFGGNYPENDDALMAVYEFMEEMSKAVWEGK